MVRSENVVFRKGYFPDTATQEEGEKFAFVSVDIGLHEADYNGVQFFYPRLQQGGYLFVHCYNLVEPSGEVVEATKNVIRQLESTLGPFKKFPLPDYCGTLVITK
ncbi:MAG: TylF/MycF family methyltransferase [Holosporales bacterium]|jgi:hypothetical protein|nr:TylF/MycF family methyltransferase [Holosporales bacterium]